jgi:hypothetical protein
LGKIAQNIAEMKISGFTMVKNADKLYYPIKAAIKSILPIVDEFVVALGDCDDDDLTRKEIESIGDPKIRIIDTVWDLTKHPNGTENAHQTDIAMKACTGDWLFYLQADEVIHENDHHEIVSKCKQYLHDPRIEGMLFNYRHFWGDYNHVHNAHGWYPKEIRIVRNHPDIHSWESAQSFRKIPGFSGKNYRQQEGTHKLKVALLNAYVYHYGWVRPPYKMQSKKQALDTIHKGEKKVQKMYENQPKHFDYGPLNKIPVFTDTHPTVMGEWIKRFNWADELQYAGGTNPYRMKMKHEKLKYRVVTWLEHNVMGGRQLGSFKNYTIIEK